MPCLKGADTRAARCGEQERRGRGASRTEFHDLLENLVEGLVGVGHNESTLGGAVVVEVGEDLHGDVRLARAGRAYNQRKAWVEARPDGLR